MKYNLDVDGWVGGRVGWLYLCTLIFKTNSLKKKEKRMNLDTDPLPIIKLDLVTMLPIAKPTFPLCIFPTF